MVLLLDDSPHTRSTFNERPSNLETIIINWTRIAFNIEKEDHIV